MALHGQGMWQALMLAETLLPRQLQQLPLPLQEMLQGLPWTLKMGEALLCHHLQRTLGAPAL